MKRLRIALASLVLLGLLFVVDALAAEKDAGGVLFYAGFDGKRDAQAKGDGAAKLMDGGGAITADGFDSMRRSAFKTGDGLGYLEFAGPGNVLPESGTIELWLKPGNWARDDGKRHQFIDIAGQGGGSLRFYLSADGVEVFQINAPAAAAQKHWDDKVPGVANTAYGSNANRDQYRQIFLVWDKDQGLRYYQAGLPDSKHPVHRSQQTKGPVPLFGNPISIRIGDFGGGKDRNAYSFLDEVYIYDRALTYEECEWANKNATSREPGKDIPADFAQPTLDVIPDPAQKRLEVRVDSGNLEAEVHGSVRLEPAAGTQPADITPDGKRYGVAWIAYSDLPAGDYRVIADIADAQGASLGTAEGALVVPEDPGRWLGNTIGISDTPPAPWTDLRADASSVTVWGRTYRLGELGLPYAIETQGESILAGPIELRVLDAKGNAIPWQSESRQLQEANAAEADITGESKAGDATATWRGHAEFDGMLRYDLAMPAGASAGGLQLRVPIKREFATLWYTDQYYSGWRGKLPQGQGVVWRTSFLNYLWLGNESVGLCAFQEDGRGWITPSNQGMRIERKGDAVTLVYDLAPGAFKLTEPWTFTFGIEATPVKPKPKGWRLWRNNAPGANIYDRWPSAAEHHYFSMPSPRNEEWFKALIKEQQAAGKRVIFYSGLNFVSPEIPECVWFRREWANPGYPGAKTDKFPTWTFLSVVPTWVDFAVWKNVELMNEYGYDGIYVDFAGARFPTYVPEQGLGYERDGKQRASLPIWNTREIWKRIYTAFRQRKPESLIVGHDSAAVHVPVLAFCDVWLDGEGNWKGQLRDNYLDVLPLDVLRAEFMGHPFGAVTWWLPQWNHAVPTDPADIAGRNSDGTVLASERLCHNMFGLGLLHDLCFWPICGTNPEASKPFYAALDAFGMGDAAFFGYWDNADLIGGQTDAIKASAYRKPDCGALVVVYNTSHEPVDAKLTAAWDRLKSAGPLAVTDAYSGDAIATTGDALTLTVPPLNYRLVRVE